MTSRSMATPAMKVTMKASGIAIGERGRLVRHETLHEVARIGADHDELAMGHVDDPHDAESDGEPDGGEKVDRSERYSVEREVEEPVETDARLDPVQPSRAQPR